MDIVTIYSVRSVSRRAKEVSVGLARICNTHVCLCIRYMIRVEEFFSLESDQIMFYSNEVHHRLLPLIGFNSFFRFPLLDFSR